MNKQDRVQVVFSVVFSSSTTPVNMTKPGVTVEKAWGRLIEDLITPKEFMSSTKKLSAVVSISILEIRELHDDF